MSSTGIVGIAALITTAVVINAMACTGFALAVAVIMFRDC